MPLVPARIRLVVPVRGGPDSKTRLVPPPGVDHATLAAALADDTLAALAHAPSAAGVLVSGDPRACRVARRAGLGVVADPGLGLNAAIRRAWSPSSSPVGALLGDLPALTPGDLEVALRACRVALDSGAPAAFVPDADGTGTVLVVAADARFVPRFGPDSARSHAAAGVRLDLDLPRLRQDVDTAADLARAVALGVGVHTRRALQHASSAAADTGGDRERPLGRRAGCQRPDAVVPAR